MDTLFVEMFMLFMDIFVFILLPSFQPMDMLSSALIFKNFCNLFYIGIYLKRLVSFVLYDQDLNSSVQDLTV